MGFSIQKFWNLIINNRATLIEERTLNAVSFIIGVLFIILTVGNYLILGSAELSIVSFVVFLLLALVFYLNRIKRKRKLATGIFVASVYILQTFIYWYNGGKDGPSILIYFLSFQILVTITPVKTHKYWLLLHMVSVVWLFIAEFIFSEHLPLIYATIEQRLIDLIFSYEIILLSVFLFLQMLLNNLASLIKTHNEKHTELEALQLELAYQNKMLEDKNKNKTALFSELSKNLQEPFTTIELTFQKIAISKRSIDDNIKDQLLKITKSTNELLTNILFWSKAQIDETQPTYKPLELSEFFNTDLRNSIQNASERNKAIHFTCTNNSSTITDRFVLAIILSNLISILIQRSANKEPIELTFNATDNFLYVSVFDSGSTFIPEELSLIKNNESIQLKNSTLQENQIDLSLKVAHTYTELLKGELKHNTSLNLGTTFILKINNSHE